MLTEGLSFSLHSSCWQVWGKWSDSDPKTSWIQAFEEKKKKKIPRIWSILKGEFPDISAESLLTSFALKGMFSLSCESFPTLPSPPSPQGLCCLPAAPHTTLLPFVLHTPCCSLNSGWSSVFARPDFQTPAFYPSTAILGFTPLGEKGIPRP